MRDYMEKFKAIVLRIDIPDHIAIDALMNSLLINSKFRKDLYRQNLRRPKAPTFAQSLVSTRLAIK